MKENNPDQDIFKVQVSDNLSISVSDNAHKEDLGLLETSVLEKLNELRRMQDNINSQRKKLPRIYHNLFSHTKYISALGWYVSPNLIRDVPLNEIVELFREENVTQFEKFLIELADSVISRLLKRCSNRFPNRAEIFEEIGKLYELEFYRAVILLCYTQVDGMSNDFWGFGFFDKDRTQEYKLKSYLKLQELDRGVSSGFADQLSISLNEITINSSHSMFTNDPELQFKTFNRHHIIHGHSIMYGSKTNAIRAIYLLDFFCYWTNDQGKSIYED